MNATDALPIGATFTKRTERPYTTPEGVKAVHEVTVLARVTSVGPVGFEWEAVEVVAESGRPAHFATSAPTGGSMAWFGFEAALSRGDIEVRRA